MGHGRHRPVPRTGDGPVGQAVHGARNGSNNPIYRTLKELYFLASDWLLKQGEIEGMDEAERQRLNFHLRQFVDADEPVADVGVESRRLAGPWRPAGPASPDGHATC